MQVIPSLLVKTGLIFSTDLKKIYSFSPPYPIKQFYYRCDRKFHLDDLIGLYEIYDNYAIVLVSGKRTELYIHNKNETIFLKSMDEELPNQHKTGGQSAQRFGRIRDEKIGWYIKKIVELMIKFYIKDNIFKYKGLIIAGPAEMKNMVKDNELFQQKFSKYLLKCHTIPEITSQSINQVLDMSSDIFISNQSDTELIDLFEERISKNNSNDIDLIVFGNKEIIDEFDAGNLKEIYVYDKSIHKEYIKQNNSKTKINIFKSNIFSKKYGELIGIKYFVNDIFDNNN